MKLRSFFAVLFGLALIATGSSLAAQATVTVGTGTSTTTSMSPIYRSTASSTFDYSRYYILYNQTDLSALPNNSTLTDIEFYLASGDTSAGSTAVLNVYLRNTNATNYTTSGTWDTTGATLVYSNNAQTITSPGGFYSFGTWSSNFVYTGGGIEVLIDWDISGAAGSPTTGGFSWQYTSRTGSSSDTQVIGQGGSSQGTTLSNTSPNNYSRLPNVRFTYQAPDQLLVADDPVGGFAAGGDTDLPVGGFTLSAFNATDQDLTDLTVSQTGSINNADVTNVKLWHDQNGNGVLDTGEPQLGSTVATLSGSQATFTSGTQLITVAGGSTESILVTADIAAAATPGATVGFEVTASTDVTASPGPVSGSYPVDGGSRDIVTYSATLPFVEDFDGASLASNVAFITAAGDYPTSTGVGNTPGSSATTANGTALVTGAGNATPQSGTDYVWTWHANQSAVAIDTRMDLSAYDVSTDTIEYRFSYWVDGLDTTYSQFNYAFVSVDGGQTWVDTLFDIDENAPSGWQPAIIDLSAALSAAGSNFTNRVVLRVQVADNLSSDHTYFEDIIVREVPASLEVDGGLPPSDIAPFAISPSGDIEVLALALTANINDQTVSDITVTNSGTVADADITDVKLWNDANGNGVVDSGETQLGTTQQFNAGTATFSNLNLVITAGSTENLLVTYAFAAGATGSVGCELASAGDITSTPDPVMAAVATTFPYGGTLGDLLEPIAALPYSENFDSATLARNIGRVVQAGTYPTASTVGGSTSTDTTSNDGELYVAGTTAGTAPNSGSGQVVYQFSNGQAAAAMDFHFDLSAYSAASDQIEFSFAWTDDGLDGGTTNEPFDYVFLSTDGGATWETAAFFIDPNLETSTINNTYSTTTIDISDVLNSVGANFTSDMVIRVQVADDFSSDYLMVDDVSLEYVPPTAPTIGTPVASGAGLPDILYYKFNEGTGTSTANDAQPGQGNATSTFSGSPTWITSGQQLGTAALQMGSGTSGDGKIYTGWAPNLTSSDSWTMETWIRYSGSSFHYLAGDSSASSWRVYFLGSTGNISMRGGGISTHDTSTGGLNDGNWHHVAFVYDASTNESHWYLDGTLDSTQTNQTPSISGTDFQIGGYSTSTTSYQWYGDVDEFRFWGSARSAADIQSSMNSEVTDIPGLNISGAGPNYTATVDLGGNLDFMITADDVNTADTLTWTVTDLGTGSLTPAQAGFNQAFTTGVYNDPNPNSAAPHTLAMSGIAADTGTVDLELQVTDGTFTTTVTLSITIQLGSPIVRVDNVGNMDFFTYSAGTPSVFTESFEVSGYALTANLDVTAPTDFEVSTSSTGGFSGSVSLTPSGTNGIVSATTIHVRYNPTTAGPHAQEIDNASTGASSVTVPVTGDIIPQTAPVLETPRMLGGQPEVLYYKFNEGTGNTTANDAIPGRGNATASIPASASWLTPGNIGTSSLSFNGDPIDTGWTTDIGAGDWTVEFHLNVAAGQFGYICGDTGASSWRVFTGGAAGTNGITMRGGGLTNLDINGAVDGTWHHVAFVYDSAAGTVTGYLDGVQAAQNTGQNLNLNGSGYYVGSYTATATPMVGDMDEFRFWSTARTQGEIQASLNTEIQLDAMVLSGTAPNYTASAYIGDDLETTFNATDVNTLETLTYTVTVTGGSLTAAQAGFNQTFTGGIYNDPSPGQAPHSLQLTGTAAQAGTLDLEVTVEDSTGLQDTYNIAITISPKPTITVTGTLLDPFFAPSIGTPSPEQSFSVSAVDLIDDLEITAPAEFEVSLTSGSGFGGNIAIPPTGGSVAATTVFVRYNPTVAGPLLAQPLNVTSTDAQPFTFDIDGYIGNLPTLATSLTPLTTFTTDAVGNPSSEQVFNIDATDLVGDITVTAPAEFQVSTSSGVGFGSSVTISASDPFPTTTVFVRYNPSATGPHSGDITVSTPGPVSTTVAVSGEISSGGGGSGGSGGGGSSGGGGCVAGVDHTGMWGLFLGALALLILALRVRAARE